jgi:hypothetical protein
MHLRRISPWRWAALIAGFLAVIAISAVPLVLGKDAVMTIAVIPALGADWGRLAGYRLSQAHLRRIAALRK